MKILPNINKPCIGFRYRVQTDPEDYDWEIVGEREGRWVIKSLNYKYKYNAEIFKDLLRKSFESNLIKKI